MKNSLRIIEAGLSKADGYIAIFSGITGMGEKVKEEEAHHIFGDSIEEIIRNSLNVWGSELDIENTDIDFDYND